MSIRSMRKFPSEKGDEKIFEAHIGLKYDQMKDEVEKVFKTAAEA